MDIKKNKIQLLLIITILLGAGLRLYHLGWNSLWYDEATIAVNPNGISRVLESLFKVDEGALFLPSHFVFFSWAKVFGNSEFILRLLPAICGIISIYFIFKLGRYIFGNKSVGLFSAFLIAISPFHVYYAQEMRIYTMVVLLSMISVYFLVKALKNNLDFDWAGYSLINTLSLYMHFSACYILFSEIIFFLLNWRRHKVSIRKWLISNLLIFILLIPWLSAVFIETALVVYRKSPFWGLKLPPISGKNIFLTLEHMSLGFSAGIIMYIISIIIFTALFIYSLFKIKNKEGLSLLLGGLCIPVFTVYVISKFRMCYVDEYLLSSSIFFYLIVAYGIEKIGSGLFRGVILSAIFLLSMFSLRNHYLNIFPRPYSEHIGVHCTNDFRQAAKYVIDNFRQADCILHVDKRAAFPFEYYFAREGITADNGVILRLNESQFLIPSRYSIKHNKYSDVSQEVSINKKNRVWLILYFDSLEQKSLVEKISGLIKEEFLAYKCRMFQGIKVCLFER